MLFRGVVILTEPASISEWIALQFLLQGRKPDQFCQLFLFGELLPERRILIEQNKERSFLVFVHCPIEIPVNIVLMVVHSDGRSFHFTIIKFA